MNDALHKYKERELERQVDQTQRPRYVSRFEHLALHPRLHHRVGFPIHYLPPREPSPRRICYNTRSTELLSQTTTSQPRGRPVANTTTNTSTEEGYKPISTSHQREHTTSLNLYQRGSKPITRSTSTKEGYNKSKGVYNKWFLSTTNQSLFSFSTKQDPNRLGQKISSSVKKNQVFGKQKLKEKYLGKTLVKDRK